MVRCSGYAPDPPRSQLGMQLLHQHLAKWSRRRDSHSRDPIYETGAYLLSHVGKKWRSHTDLHREPLPSQGSVQFSYTLGAKKWRLDKDLHPEFQVRSLA